jgi:FSR family fosmidomycin resistance protein-like MFS transporter
VDVDTAAPVRIARTDHPLRLALILSLAHGLNDSYASFVPPLLPRIMGNLDLSIAMATTLAVVFSVASALPQPLFGYLADRFGRRAFAVGGPLVVGVFVSAMGWAEGFVTLVVLLTIAGAGSAAFHPPGASYAVRLSAGHGGGVRYAIFSFGGAMGFAAGPLIAVGLVQWRGMDGLTVAMLPVLLFGPLLFFALPSGRAEVRSLVRPPPPPLEVLRQLRGPLGLIFGVSAIMAFVQRAFLTMEPMIVANAGGSEQRGALVLSVYLGAQAFGTVAGGLLTDRMDRRALLAHLCGWACLVHLLLAVWVGPFGPQGLVTAAAAGFLGMAVVPPVVVMAQELVPDSTAVGSGIVMGLAWATGAAAVLATGALADVFGPQLATLWSMPMALVGVALALMLPRVGATPGASEG